MLVDFLQPWFELFRFLITYLWVQVGENLTGQKDIFWINQNKFELPFIWAHQNSASMYGSWFNTNIASDKYCIMKAFFSCFYYHNINSCSPFISQIRQQSLWKVTYDKLKWTWLTKWLILTEWLWQIESMGLTEWND